MQSLPTLSFHKRFAPFTHPSQCIHAEIDFGHTYPEIRTRQAAQYYKSILKIYCFFIRANGQSFGFFWRESVGGKGKLECLHCLWIFLWKYSTGAGHLSISLDTAGHVWSEDLIFLSHFISSPQNPKRLFFDVHLIPLEKGGTENGADLNSGQVDNALARLDNLPLLTIDEYLDWISRNTNMIVEKVEKFVDIPSMLQRSGIYKKISGSLDLDGFIGPKGYGIRKYRPLSCFIMRVPDFCDEHDGEERLIPNDVWFQSNLDDTKPMIRIRILKDEFLFGEAAFGNIFHPVMARSLHKIKEEFWQLGWDLIEHCFSERPEILEYWDKSTLIAHFDNADSDADEETQKGESNVEKVLKNLREISSAVENEPKFANVAKKRKEKAERKARYERGCDGKCAISFTPTTVGGLTVKQIRAEMYIHCIPPVSKGTKFDDLKSLVEHYGSKDHIDQRKWDKKMIKKALEGKKKVSKAGRKRKA